MKWEERDLIDEVGGAGVFFFFFFQPPRPLNRSGSSASPVFGRLSRVLTGSWTNGFEQVTGPEGGPVPGSTGPTGRSGPVFRTMVWSALAGVVGCIEQFFRYHFLGCHGFSFWVVLMPFFCFSSILSLLVFVSVCGCDSDCECKCDDGGMNINIEKGRDVNRYGLDA